MADTDHHDEQDAKDREDRPAPAKKPDDPEGGPVTSEEPAGDASEAAEQFSREEGEAPSG